MPSRQNTYLFATDLHGQRNRYESLSEKISAVEPAALFLGGDLLPHRLEDTFIEQVLIPGFAALKARMADRYPQVYLILGNDDPRIFESAIQETEEIGLWSYVHNRNVSMGKYSLYGYACVPPTPFLLKDWERYDVSRYCDPGCVSPEDGIRTVAVDNDEIRWGTIENDLTRLTGLDDMRRAIFLFHSPPYDTALDRAALDGKFVDHAPLDVHVGSIAIRRFIEQKQPRLTMHGHVHEAARITGEWMTTIGRTVCISAAHDGPELALVSLDLENPENSTRELI
ncbi:MAG: metallophosphoesterase [Terriglobia bacterium]|jgi:Icc-related predicted phosphoesterase|nr:metallophosphoesterase [Terriglobia bacterium]